jgi:octaprenyl-diphosphate synthase
LREGKATLPLIIAMQRATQAERTLIEQAIVTGGIDNMEKIIDIVQKTGALTATRNAAAVEAQRALDALQNLPQNVYADALKQLASQLLDRRA